MKDRHIRSMSTWLGPLAARLFLCSLVTVCALPAQVIAQELSLTQFNHRVWTTWDGAPADVWSMAQTPDGWLWFGAPTALYRFDGVHFERVTLEGLDSRRSRAISALYASDTGALWIGYVYGGASLLKDGRFTHFGAAQGFGRGTVVSLAEDTRGAVWAACADALLRYDGRQWTHIGSDWGFPDTYAAALFVDQRGTLWVAGEHEIFFLERQSRRFQPTGIRAEGRDSSEFMESPDGRTWYTDDTGIHRLPRQSAGPPRASIINARTSYSRLIDRNGTAWLSALTKLQRLPFDHAHSELLFSDHPNPDSFTTKDALGDAHWRTMLEDREGNVWAATGSGVDRFRPTNVHSLPPELGEAGHYALAPAENGSVWIGSHFGNARSPLDGLWKFDGRLKRISVPGITRVTAVDIDANGTLWIAGPEGVWRQEANERFRKIAELPEGTRGQLVHALTIDLDGNPWVSVVRSRLFRYRDGAWERNGNLAALPDQRPQVHARDDHGRLWFGYRNGTLAVIDSAHVKILGAAEGLDLGTIFALHVGPHTVVAGENRVAVLNDSRFHVITTPADPTVLEGVTGILESKSGDLWLSGFKGAVHVTAADLDRALQSRTYELRFELFDAEDGFPGMAQQVRPVATMIEGSDGRLWVAGSRNVAWLDPTSIRRNTVPPLVSIRALTAAGRRYSTADALSLAPGTRDLQIDYTAPGLSRPERVRFRYQLVGFDKGWVEAGSRRQAFYTNLDPGQYKFLAAAANESGIWNTSGPGLEIGIRPTFVQTKAFVGLCAAAAVILLWFAYALRVRRLTTDMRNRLEARVEERERIARELHDTLLQGVQGLMFRLHAVRELLPGRPEEAAQALKGALQCGDQAIAEGRAAVQDLRTTTLALGDLAEALMALGPELLPVGLAQQPSYHVLVEGKSRPLMPLVRDESYRLAREAVRNAIQHARARQIEVELVYGETSFCLRIRDDGIGVDARVLEASRRGGHWGIPGMYERAESLGAHLELWSEHGVGTELLLEVPATTAYGRGTVRAAAAARHAELR